MKKYFLLLSIVLISFSINAQPGKNGNYTVTASNAVLNKYSPLISNASIGSFSLAVLTQTTMLNLCPGDLIMIYQAQGAAITVSNNINYGQVSAYGSAGNYEFSYVKFVGGNIIFLTTPLVNNYSVSGMAQVIKVPQYNFLTLIPGAKILAKPWKDTTVGTSKYRFGGVIAIHSSAIFNDGTITASGLGFRGGMTDVLNTTAYGGSITNYVSATNWHGGEKGESISGFQSDYDIIGGRYGRGAAANGGGGGNGWNAGGGGGANALNGNSWTGQGVMTNTITGAAAWNLDPGYIANSNALTNSAGGGRGGYSVGWNAMNPLSFGPNNISWGGDSRSEVGGLGGRPLSNINYNNRIYFGGGGGAGDENNACGANGGAGGGIVFLFAGTSITGIGSILSDGSNGGNTILSGVDAPSGAGAGGSIVIKSGFISPTQIISAKGGNGGNQIISAAEFEGPGGGGGGGFVAVSSAALANVSGGNSGTTNSPLMTAFPSNGATCGASGQTVTASTSFIAYNANDILNANSNSPVCSGSSLNLTSALYSSASYSWAGPNSFNSSQQNPVISNVLPATAGIYSLSLTLWGCIPVTGTVSVSVTDCTGFEETQIQNDFVKIYPNPATESVRINFEKLPKATVKITDLTGKLIYLKENEYKELELDLKKISRGIYFVTVLSFEKVGVFKLVVQ